MRVDPIAIAKECKKTGTIIELNARRLCFDEAEAKKMVDMGTKFILDSDAHICTNVGECNKGLNFVVKNNIPQNLVVNLDKTPNFCWTADID